MKREKLIAYLKDCPWKEQIILLDEVQSTNLTARELAMQGAPHGTVVLAEYQSDGKGRMGRTFFTPKAMGIYCSFVLRFSQKAEELLFITPVAAEAARRAIVCTTGLSPQIKWVNDLVLQDRKLCGILTQLQTDTAGETVAILGIGINCRQKIGDFPEELRSVAISLAQAGSTAEREAVAAELVRQVFLAVNGDCKPWMEAYRQNCLTVGRDVQLVEGDLRQQAYAEDVDDTGALLVILPDGSRKRVFSGEVSVRGLYGYV